MFIVSTIVVLRKGGAPYGGKDGGKGVRWP